MTIATLGWFIAAICMTSFITLWLLMNFSELSTICKSLDLISDQMLLHCRLYMQEGSGEHDIAAQKGKLNRG